MNYDEALAYIHGTYKFGIKVGLHNIKRLLELMGNPHKQLKYVHVAGTNGKGSTVAFISSILKEAGYKVGVYTSPYIQRFTERIRINDTEILKEELAGITAFVKEKIDIMLASGEQHPTEFEIVTAVAFQYFAEKKCDIVVLEVGLGGRFDSTNIIDAPLVSVITTINYDHMHILGDTLAEIAFEKAGIIKENCEVVLYPQIEEVHSVFLKVCSERNANLHEVDFSGLSITEFGIGGQSFTCGEYRSLKISLLGQHQPKNAMVALKAIEILRSLGYGISTEAIERGLAGTRWPGRLEVLLYKPVFLIDGAHNAEGANALTQALKRYFPNKKIKFIIGIVRDKDLKPVLEAVADIAHSFITVTTGTERAMPAKELAKFIKPYCKNVTVGDTIENAVRTSLEAAADDDVICAFGSLYYIGQVRELLLKD